MNRLRELREDRHISQEALGEMINSSQQNIFKYENDITEPDIQTLKMLASVFHTSIDYLVEYNPEEYPDLLEKYDPAEHDYVIHAPDPDTKEHIDGERLELLLSYDKCRPNIKSGLLQIISELAKKQARYFVMLFLFWHVIFWFCTLCCV